MSGSWQVSIKVSVVVRIIDSHCKKNDKSQRDRSFGMNDNYTVLKRLISSIRALHISKMNFRSNLVICQADF